MTTAETPNENSLKFLPGVDVMGPKGTKEFTSYKEAQQSPLAKELFKVDGVRSVYFGPDFISVNKDENSVWGDMKIFIFSVITDFYASGEPVVKEVEETSDTTILPEDDETVALIKEIIETRVRPGVQDDGGDIEYKVCGTEQKEKERKRN